MTWQRYGEDTEHVLRREKLCKEGFSDEWINNFFVEELLEARKQQQAEEPIQESEEQKSGIAESLSQIDREANEKKQKLIQNQQLLDEETDFNAEIRSKKMELLGRIEDQINTKMQDLDAQIAETETERKRLQTLYEEHSKKLAEERQSEREIFRRTLTNFFQESLFNILNNFADSETEKSLILLFNREGSVIALKSVQSTKAILTQDDLKIKG